MPAPPVPDAELARVVEAHRLHDSHITAAASIGLPETTFRRRLRMAQDRGLLDFEKPSLDDFTVAAPPEERLTAAELLKRRSSDFIRKQAAKEARKLIQVSVKIDGPFGIAHFGDPHVDDDGTDLAQLQADVETIKATKGLFAGNVGDFSNNWVGRLARLYGEQSTSAHDAWTLVEWLVSELSWLYLVGGNHDAWSGAGDPLRWIAKQAGALYEMHGARLALSTPNGRNFRGNARHDFKGHSMWNPAHGPSKAAQMGWRDHILTCGHTHVSGYQLVKDPSSGLITHAIRVASYKIYDSYAESQGLPNQTIFTCPVTIIDPNFADNDRRCVTFLPDVQEAASYLTWKRSRWTRGRST